jgi:hypothetical protein
LAEATLICIDTPAARPLRLSAPIRVRLRLADVTTPQRLEAIPGVKHVDGYTSSSPRSR